MKYKYTVLYIFNIKHFFLIRVSIYNMLKNVERLLEKKITRARTISVRFWVVYCIFWQHRRCAIQTSQSEVRQRPAQYECLRSHVIGASRTTLVFVRNLPQWFIREKSTQSLQNNGVVSEVDKKIIFRLTRFQHTPIATVLTRLHYGSKMAHFFVFQWEQKGFVCSVLMCLLLQGSVSFVYSAIKNRHIKLTSTDYIDSL